MNLNQVLRDENLQLAILNDAIAEYEQLENCSSNLIGELEFNNGKDKNTTNELVRPISIVTLMAEQKEDASNESPESSVDDLKCVVSPGTAWWERTWIILSIIFVSPTFRAALQSEDNPQKEWLNGNETLSSFQNRFESYICGNSDGAIAVTPLEAVVEEITLWEYLNS